jgi:hypothetical protein
VAQAARPRGAALSSRAPKRAPAPDTAGKGLDPLDRDRALSLADEGGSAGAHVDAQVPGPATQHPPGPDEKTTVSRRDEEAEERAPGRGGAATTPAFDDTETPAMPTRIRRGNGSVE